MARWPKFKETSPQAITVDGHPGLKFVMTSSAASTCAALGSIWQTTSGMGVDVYPMITDSANKGPGTFEIVDTGHGLLVIRTGGVPPDLADAADQTALKEVLDSIRLIAQPG